MKAKRVCDFYCLAIRLKDVIRKGFINACVKKERMESVAEHVYGTLNLAIAIYYTYKPKNIDLSKVLFMLAIHELDEICIGDVALTDTNYVDAKKASRDAVISVLSSLEDDGTLLAIIDEFDAASTNEAKFAYLCDKLECDLYVKVLSEKGCFDIEELKKKDNLFSRNIKTGKETLAEVWLPGDEEKFSIDETFKEIFEYARDNDIIDN